MTELYLIGFALIALGLALHCWSRMDMSDVFRVKDKQRNNK